MADFIDLQTIHVTRMGGSCQQGWGGVGQERSQILGKAEKVQEQSARVGPVWADLKGMPPSVYLLKVKGSHWVVRNVSFSDRCQCGKRNRASDRILATAPNPAGQNSVTTAEEVWLLRSGITRKGEKVPHGVRGMVKKFVEWALWNRWVC